MLSVCLHKRLVYPIIRMKKISVLIIIAFIGFFQCSAEDSKELELFGIKINYQNGSWVNPDEVKFAIKNPDSWVRRNYIRNYLQGSNELRGALIDIDWKAIWKAGKSGEKIPLKNVISVLDFKRALNGLKKHPEGIIVTATFAVNVTSDSLRDAFWIMRSTFRGIKLLAIGKKKFFNKDKIKQL